MLCQQRVVVAEIADLISIFFANPSKPTYCQFMYVISKPKKPEAWNREPSGETNRKFRTSTRVRTCGRADVRTCGRADTRYPGIRICPSLNGRGRPCLPTAPVSPYLFSKKIDSFFPFSLGCTETYTDINRQHVATLEHNK